MLLTVNIIGTNNAALNADITIDATTTTNVNNASEVLADNSTVTVTVTKTGYYSFSTNINVFDVDATISIKICPVITNINDPNYNRPYPHFFYLLDPCSYDVHIYNGSASPYTNIEYYINNESISVQSQVVHRFNTFGDYQIKQRLYHQNPWTGQIYFDVFKGSFEVVRNLLTQTVEQVLTLDVITNTTLVNIVPDFSIDITNPEMIIDSVQYNTLRGEVTITPSFTLNNPHCVSGTLEYKIYNSFNNLLFEYQVSTTAPTIDLAYTFSLDYVGDYRIEASIIDCCNKFTIIKYVNAADFILIYPISDGCNLYRISNFSTAIDMYINVSAITGEPITPSTLVAAGTSYDLTIPELGTYKVVVNYEYLDVNDNTIPVEKIYFITAYCGVEECLADYMIKLFCKEDCNCKDKTKLILMINKINALLFMYFSHLNNLYTYNRVFDVLSDSDLNNFLDADLILTKLSKFCNGTECNCGC
jgi:hypothetical protein